MVFRTHLPALSPRADTLLLCYTLAIRTVLRVEADMDALFEGELSDLINQRLTGTATQVSHLARPDAHTYLALLPSDVRVLVRVFSCEW